jgi:hypothetical protein
VFTILVLTASPGVTTRTLSAIPAQRPEYTLSRGLVLRLGKRIGRFDRAVSKLRKRIPDLHMLLAARAVHPE